MDGSAPLIVIAELPPDLQAFSNTLRQAHFPPSRNFLEAHVTLFHALPPFCRDEAQRHLKDVTRTHPPVKARLTGVMSLGRGTAFAIDSPDLLAICDSIADRFHGLLTGQDQHRPRLHVTVQNKVAPAVAKALQAELAATFVARDFTFRGLALHAYLGGPWQSLARYSFRG